MCSIMETMSLKLNRRCNPIHTHILGSSPSLSLALPVNLIFTQNLLNTNLLNKMYFYKNVSVNMHFNSTMLFSQWFFPHPVIVVMLVCSAQFHLIFISSIWQLLELHSHLSTISYSYFTLCPNRIQYLSASLSLSLSLRSALRLARDYLRIAMQSFWLKKRKLMSAEAHFNG